MRYFIEFAYNGKAYHGWQYQPNAITVQEILEKTMTLILGEKISLTAAGRTDAGVHAEQMYAHFDFNSTLGENLIFKLNSFLPKDIAVKGILEVKQDAHARFDAVTREYIYKINPVKNPFYENLAYDYHLPLDVTAMIEASNILLDYKDFQCFSKSNTDVNTFNCAIMETQWTVHGDLIIFNIKADRFLRNMVRAIVGTMIEIGSHKLKVADLDRIIKSKDRSEAGFSVPAHGLYLHKITYPKSVFR